LCFFLILQRAFFFFLAAAAAFPLPPARSFAANAASPPRAIKRAARSAPIKGVRSLTGNLSEQRFT
jgi:hypothetical protein